MKRWENIIASFAANTISVMRHFAINIKICCVGYIQEAAMKRAILFAIVLMALGASPAFSAVSCPDIQYLGQFDTGPVGADLARAAAGEDRKVYVADVKGGFLRVYHSDGTSVENKRMKNIISVGVYGDTVFIGKGRDTKGGYKSEVEVYNSSLQKQFSLGSGLAEFKYPVAMVSDGTKIFVADNLTDKVKAYSLADGSALFSFGGSSTVDYGSDDSDTPKPTGLAIHPVSGNVYVSDAAYTYDPGSWTYGPGVGVHVFSAADGSFISKFPISWGYSGAPGQMQVASGIAIDSQGRVYVTDSSAGSVEVFDDAGSYVCDVASTNGTVFQHTPDFTTDGRFVFASVGGLFTYSTEDYVGMSTSPSTLDYTAQTCSASPSGQALTVSNSGPGTMNWTASTDATWLSVGSSSGSIVGAGSEDISVIVDESGLDMDTYTGSVTVSSEGGTAVIEVTLGVYGPPSLVVTRNGAPYDFLVNGNYYPPSKPLIVNIDGDQTGLIGWNVSADEAWISVAPASGPSGTDTIGSVSINSAALSGVSTGNYAGNITVSAGCASVSDVTVPVGLEYYEGGTIKVVTNVEVSNYSITGPKVFSGSGILSSIYDVSPGTYTITFDPVQGYITPASYSMTLSGQDTITFTGNYTDLREANNIIVTMGGATKWSINDTGRVFDGDGTALETFIIKKKSKGKLLGGTVAASGDIDGDGVDDIVIADDRGVIRAFTGDGTAMPGIRLYGFKGVSNIDLAVGDLDGDGTDEIIVGSGTAMDDEALVRVYSYSGGSVSDTGLFFRAYSDNFGVNVSAGDIDGDGIDEILTTRAGAGGREVYIRVWQIASGSGPWSVVSSSEIAAGVSFEPADITAGDIDADGVDEILVTRLEDRSDSTSRIVAFKADGTQVLDFAGPSTGIMIASGDINSDGAAEVVVTEGQSSLSSTTIRIYGADGAFINKFKAYTNSNIYGATVTLGQTVGQ